MPKFGGPPQPSWWPPLFIGRNRNGNGRGPVCAAGQAQTQEAQNGQGVHVYVTQSSHGTWLFSPTGNAGANS
jgi:hypothetical protein